MFFITTSNRTSLFPILLLITIHLHCGANVPQLKPDSRETDSCIRIPTEPGPEDMEIIRSQGVDRLFYSSHDRRNPDRLGGIHSIPLDKESLRTSKFVSSPLNLDKNPEYFRPHGISHSLYKGKNRLYVISHPHNNVSKPLDSSIPKHTIEVFEESSPGRWKYIYSLSDPLLESPNDLYALPEERLLVSNDMGTELNFTAILNLIFKRNTTDITYYSSGKFYPTQEKIPFGNGIWYEDSDPSRKISNTLYRSSHIDKSIYVYDVDWVENHAPLLKLRYKIPFPGGPDNLYRNEHGFFTTTHNSDLKFLDHAKSSEKISPSQVWEIRNGKETRLIYSDSGDEISAASTAIRYKDWIFISQVFESFILACRVP